MFINTYFFREGGSDNTKDDADSKRNLHNLPNVADIAKPFTTRHLFAHAFGAAEFDVVHVVEADLMSLQR